MRKSEITQGNSTSLYIHIPFCKSKCHYCNFISFANKTELIEPYFVALKNEISHYFNKYPYINLETVYIGGGTPSAVDFKYYKEIFTLLNDLTKISSNAEITMEINPGTVDFEYLKNIRTLGINRLSIGVQSFDDRLLKLINRAHSAQDAVNTVNHAKDTGFDNISIDLIYGLPSQTEKNWEKTLNSALNLEINHISAYGLKIEEKTEFYKNSPKNLPDEDIQSKIYLKTIEIHEKNNLNHYEISNFCKAGFESRHNLAYWQNKEYFGFGVASHGYLDGIRYSNTENLEEYIKNPTKRDSENKLSEAEKIEEAIFLGLRLTQGLNLDKFKSVYGVDISEKYLKIIDKHVNSGLLAYYNGYLKLTKQGILLSNLVLADFLL